MPSAEDSMTPHAVPDVGFRSERGPVLIALMLTTALIAIDATIVATAVPSIVADIGGFTSFPWLFSSYLLAQAVTVPVYAKVSDMVGRKPVVLVGIGLFLLGSVLCGFAWSMPVLIVARLVQGLGAGAVQPMAITIAGDIYTVAERARVQGYLASVWAVSSVLGPTLGGVFASLGLWRAIFFVNVPVCLLAAWMLARSFHESVHRQRHKVDVLGSFLLTVALSLLMLALLEGGHTWAWDSPVGVGMVAAGAVLLVLFVLVERRAAEPVLPGFVLTRRLLLTTTLIAFGVGAILLGLTSYVPTYLESVLGAEPVVAGLALAALTIGWPIAASQAGRIYLRLGFRATNLIGVALVVAGTVLLALVVTLFPALLGVAAACFVVGLGLGLTSTPSIVAAQSSVEWAERGVVTGTNMFSRSVGSAFGVAVFGALSNAVYTRLGNHGPEAIAEATGVVFIAAVVAAVLTAAAVLAMPRVSATPAA
ncbi:EmrB/QacA subfamily drug resistance transporter [Georgenia soli]|uniref:EmrB/QacA subfamily drug resistance transporter n=1 Tax=Georgenia soli TaxID=638953 RepID=A0A2A9ERB5_9MICO|nr:MFS transporter [Georgenia soli]PFG41071.1 EmrB/QacA subfamily drug resistance transporter [Georgenia soli]